MSNTDYTQLLKNIGVNQFNENGSLSKDWEHWQSLVIHTNEGLKFTESGLTEVYHTLRSFNATASQGILEMIADDLTQYESLSSTVKYIHELRKKIQETDKRDEDKIKQYEDELELAEKILRIRSQDPD
jgi:predicted ribosome quality control (RQC) complex YloA/Tae2 family protein